MKATVNRSRLRNVLVRLVLNENHLNRPTAESRLREQVQAADDESPDNTGVTDRAGHNL